MMIKLDVRHILHGQARMLTHDPFAVADLVWFPLRLLRCARPDLLCRQGFIGPAEIWPLGCSL